MIQPSQACRTITGTITRQLQRPQTSNPAQAGGTWRSHVQATEEPCTGISRPLGVDSIPAEYGFHKGQGGCGTILHWTTLQVAALPDSDPALKLPSIRSQHSLAHRWSPESRTASGGEFRRRASTEGLFQAYSGVAWGLYKAPAFDNLPPEASPTNFAGQEAVPFLN